MVSKIWLSISLPEILKKNSLIKQNKSFETKTKEKPQNLTEPPIFLKDMLMIFIEMAMYLYSAQIFVPYMTILI